jgi:hypothetical protein
MDFNYESLLFDWCLNSSFSESTVSEERILILYTYFKLFLHTRMHARSHARTRTHTQRTKQNPKFELDMIISL